MTTAGHRFRRVVLGLQPVAPLHSLRLAADFAGSLHAEILGLFVEDPALKHFAQMPFARELSFLGGSWRPIEQDTLSADLAVAARSSQRTFSEATLGRSANPRFEVVGDPGSIEALSQPDDIVVIFEPSTPADRITHQFAALRRAVFQSRAAVMFVPQHVARTAGPVLVITQVPDEAALRPVANLAAALATDLVIAQQRAHAAEDDRAIQHLARSLGIRITRAPETTQPSMLEASTSSERMIVVDRGTVDVELVPQIAAARCVPVLLVGPPRAGKPER